jgi:hypothetical protein
MNKCGKRPDGRNGVNPTHEIEKGSAAGNTEALPLYKSRVLLVDTDCTYTNGWPNRSRCATSASGLRCFFP